MPYDFDIFRLFTAMGTAGALMFLFVLFVLFILMPFSMYAAQKWANRSYQELRKIRKLLEDNTTHHPADE